MKHDVVKLSVNPIAQRVLPAALDLAQNFTCKRLNKKFCALFDLQAARSQLTQKRFLIPAGSIPGRTSASVGR